MWTIWKVCIEKRKNHSLKRKCIAYTTIHSVNTGLRLPCATLTEIKKNGFLYSSFFASRFIRKLNYHSVTCNVEGYKNRIYRIVHSFHGSYTFNESKLWFGSIRCMVWCSMDLFFFVFPSFVYIDFPCFALFNLKIETKAVSSILNLVKWSLRGIFSAFIRVLNKKEVQTSNEKGKQKPFDIYTKENEKQNEKWAPSIKIQQPIWWENSTLGMQCRVACKLNVCLEHIFIRSRLLHDSNALKTLNT